tara:strand:- start:3151 stop:3363 length:213 start_codon:yes stop_codon:yes gene_type:complete
MNEDRKNITISKKNFDEIFQKIKNPINGFSTVEEYVDYVLDEILFNDDVEDLSNSEKEKVKEELKKLGYI